MHINCIMLSRSTVDDVQNVAQRLFHDLGAVYLGSCIRSHNDVCIWFGVGPFARGGYFASFCLVIRYRLQSLEYLKFSTTWLFLVIFAIVLRPVVLGTLLPGRSVAAAFGNGHRKPTGNDLSLLTDQHRDEQTRLSKSFSEV